MLTEKEIRELEKFALEIRIQTLKELGYLGFGHIGGAMSIVELLAVLYGKEMRYDPKNPKWDGRDWFILSKGHAGPALYATLALKGFFSIDLLKTLNQGGTNLPSHCDRNKTPGIDMSTGSLGQGISMGIGVALGFKMDGKSNYVYVVLGDGECQEGQVWEAALYGGNAKLDNLIVFVDYNKQQLDGYIDDINPLGDLREKWEVFGWHSQEVDGHNVAEIYDAIQKAKKTKGKSSVIILHTIKGKGCSFAEGIELNHHMKFTEEQIEQAIKPLEEELRRKERDLA
ncbi:transketolase [Kosmotoga olearia]|uniref:Transketolase domain protein n=1 Tax=Kosmotoga olearia (strain ATCC BAA-1733 / DSM 21960 / TBF 19.5.1) TaxID=521045 RepID=C5CHE6_KOSOT|nr:transketolase [Kosmotoga olearia]ACR79701.1 Transketolase domain protein [Kosmotoga olearia TBF 19.5.1]